MSAEQNASPGRVPGLDPLDLSDLPAALQRALEPRVARLGYLGDFFRYSAHQPEALLHFHQFSEALKASVPARLVECVALTVATRTGNAYERVQHERLASTVGLSDPWIDAMVGDMESPDGLAPDEAHARALALAATSQEWERARTALGALVELCGPAVAMGVLLLAGRFLAHSVVSRTLALTPPVAAKPRTGPQAPVGRAHGPSASPNHPRKEARK